MDRLQDQLRRFFGSGTKSSTFHLLGLLALIVAGGVNLIEFHAIDKTTSKNYRAFYSYETGDIFRIGTRHNGSVRHRAAPFYYFGLVSPGSAIILPTARLNSWFELDLGMMSFGRARKILFRDYNARTPLTGDDWDKYKVDLSRYSPSLNQRISIFRGSTQARTFVVLAPRGDPGRKKPMLLVDVDLLKGPLREALGHDF